ncbi:hypothetical protein V3N99_09215 [Dermatophilaceae bacterium Soc4.6]
MSLWIGVAVVIVIALVWGLLAAVAATVADRVTGQTPGGRPGTAGSTSSTHLPGGAAAAERGGARTLRHPWPATRADPSTR